MISDYNIKFISKLESGVMINNYHIQNAIERVWDTGRYLDVRIEIEDFFLSQSHQNSIERVSIVWHYCTADIGLIFKIYY